MARNENPPFDRGQTFYNGATIDTNDLGGLSLEGQEFEFEDINWSSSSSPGAKPARTNRRVRVRVVRNVAAIALLPKRLVTFQLSGVNYGARVDGYADVTSERSFPVDEYLPAAGVPVNDLFYIVVHGPALVLTPLAALANVIAVGDRVAALTAATSGATSAGRVTPLAGAVTGPDLVAEVINTVGYALSAKTTANTNADLLVEVGLVL